jgi:hypothetical protein
MPRNIRLLSLDVIDTFPKTLVSIALNRRATPPRVGTRLRNTDRINGRTEVSLRPGFTKGLEEQETVADLRAHLARHVRRYGQRFSPSAFLIFGEGNRTLHGSARI